MTANISYSTTDGDLIVFTDLDGTLLDHQSYDHSPALPTIDRLTRHGIPLILASSKTAAEMIPLRTELGLSHWPMICENGAGVVAPDETGDAAAPDYHRLRAALGALPGDLRACFEGFADMGPARIAEVTGLPVAQAELAAERRFSEPGLWSGGDDALAQFLDALRAMGIEARRGGRFLTLSFGATKASQMAQIIDQLEKRVVIALGDAPNDAEMLLAADHAIILPNDHGAPLPELSGQGRGQVMRARFAGPRGWHDSLGTVLTALGVPE